MYEITYMHNYLSWLSEQDEKVKNSIYKEGLKLQEEVEKEIGDVILMVGSMYRATGRSYMVAKHMDHNSVLISNLKGCDQNLTFEHIRKDRIFYSDEDKLIEFIETYSKGRRKVSFCIDIDRINLIKAIRLSEKINALKKEGFDIKGIIHVESSWTSISEMKKD